MQHQQQSPTPPLSMTGIVAIAKNHVIGHKNRLPWHIPQDLKRFKERTMGHILVMGRNTFESLPTFGLKGRICVVVTSKIHEPFPTHPDVHSQVIFVSIGDVVSRLMELLYQFPDKKAFVIGGPCLFDHFTPHIHKFMVTHVHKDVEGDVFYDIDQYRYSKSEPLEEFYCEEEECHVSIVSYNRDVCEIGRVDGGDGES